MGKVSWKRIEITTGILLLLVVLSGCGSYNAARSKVTTISVNRSGVIVNAIIEDFSQSYYDVTELKKTVDSENYTLEIVDITNMSILEEVFQKNKIDTVIHLAAMAGVRPSIENPMLYEKVNVKGTMNILELMKKYNINISNVIRHFDVTGKKCPMYWCGDSQKNAIWISIKNRIVEEEKVVKQSIKINGKLKSVDAINKGNYTYIKIRDLSDILNIENSRP